MGGLATSKQAHLQGVLCRIGLNARDDFVDELDMLVAWKAYCRHPDRRQMQPSQFIHTCP